MSDISLTMQKIEALHNKIVDRCHGNTGNLQKVNSFMSQLKFQGILDGLIISSSSNRFFIIDGASWVKACKLSGQTPTPTYILWEESAFFNILESLIESRSQMKAKSMAHNSR